MALVSKWSSSAFSPHAIFLLNRLPQICGIASLWEQIIPFVSCSIWFCIRRRNNQTKLCPFTDCVLLMCVSNPVLFSWFLFLLSALFHVIDPIARIWKGLEAHYMLVPLGETQNTEQYGCKRCFTSPKVRWNENGMDALSFLAWGSNEILLHIVHENSWWCLKEWCDRLGLKLPGRSSCRMYVSVSNEAHASIGIGCLWAQLMRRKKRLHIWGNLVKWSILNHIP